MLLQQEVVSLVSLLFQTGHLLRSKRLDLDRVNVKIGDHHLLRVVDGVFGCYSEVMHIPVLVNLALLRAVSVRHVVAVLDLRLNLVALHNQTNASSHTFFHVDLAVVQVAQARVHLVLQSERRTSSLVLECHGEPLVLAVRVSEDIKDGALVVLPIAQV